MAKRQLPPGWETDEGGKSEYSPTKFYTVSVDHQGHGTTAHVKIADYLLPRLHALKEAFPQHYGSIPDICRDGIRHRLEYLESNHEHVKADPEWALYVALENAAAITSKVKLFSELAGKVRETCRVLRANDDHEGLAAYIDSMTDNAEGFPEPWRSKALEELARWR